MGGDQGEGDHPHPNRSAEPFGCEPFGCEPFGREPFGRELRVERLRVERITTEALPRRWEGLLANVRNRAQLVEARSCLAKFDRFLRPRST